MATTLKTSEPTTPAGRSVIRVPLLILALVGLLGFGGDAFEVALHPLLGVDLSITHAIQQVNWGPLVAVFVGLEWLEGLKQVALASAGVLLVFAFRRRATPLMIWGALSGVVYTGAELFFHRPRPAAGLVHVIRHTSGFSFPSGHAIFFTWFLAYLVLIFFGPRLPRPVRVAAWLVAGLILVLVCVGRVYNGEHWPSDVAGGVLLGAGWTALGLAIRPLGDPVLKDG